MQTVEENTQTNLNNIRLRGQFTKQINEGKIIDVWEFETVDGDLLGISARKSHRIDSETIYEIKIRISLYYSEGKQGKIFNQNFARLLYLDKLKNKSEEME